MLPPEAGGPPVAKKKSPVGLIIGVLVALGILGGGGFFGYRYYMNKQAQPTEVTLNQPPAEQQPPAQPPAEQPPPADASPVIPPPVEATPAPANTKPAGKAAAGKGKGAKATPVPGKAAEQQPAAQAPAPTAPARPTEAPAPAQPPRREVAKAPAYSGPSSGLVIWSGPLSKKEDIVIDGTSTTAGTILQGAFPGVPVSVTAEFKEVTITDPPSAANNWKRIAFRGKKDRKIVVTFHWAVQ